MTDSSVTPENKKKKPGLTQVLVPVIAIIAIVFVTLAFLRQRSDSADPAGHSHVEGKRPEVGDTLTDIDLKTLEGETKRLSQVPGKVKLVNIWATWCGPCISEMPSLVKLREKYQSQGFEIVGINVDEDPAEVLRPFEKRFGMRFPTYIDPEGKFSDTFSVSSIPFSVVVDENMKILLVELGDRDWFSEEVQKQVEGWLQGKS